MKNGEQKAIIVTVLENKYGKKESQDNKEASGKASN